MAADNLPIPGQTTGKLTEDQSKAIVMEVLERYDVAEKFDRPFKEACLKWWKMLNNVLPADWPYFHNIFEPETEISSNDIVDQTMSIVFRKDNYFDLRAVDGQDDIQIELMRELMRYTLREHVRYRMVQYGKFQEAVFYGNGVEKHLIAPKIVRVNRRTPLYFNDGFNSVILGMQKEASSHIEFWPASKVISRFDCYPAPTGTTIQEMPYFIERIILPLRDLKVIARYLGYDMAAVDRLEGFFSLDSNSGIVSANWSDTYFDLYERLSAVGYDVKSYGTGSGGTTAIKYVELLVYTEAPAGDEGCNRMVILGNRKELLKQGSNPFDHSLKPYSDIKYRIRMPQVWQAKGVPELIEQAQVQLNLSSNQAADIVEMQAKPMTLVGPNAGVQDLTDLTPWPGAVIRVMGDPNGIVYPQKPGVPGDVYKRIEYASAMIQRASHATDYARGIAGSSTGLSKGSETASGLGKLMNAQAMATNFQYLLAEETGGSDGLNITAANLQQALTQRQVIEVIGHNPKLASAGFNLKALSIDPEHIQGRFRFYCVGAARAMETADLLGVFEQMIEKGMQLPEVAGRIKQLEVWMEAAELAGVRNPNRFIRNDQEMQNKSDPTAAKARQKIAESIKYKDMPPDIQRQVEQYVGLQPSQIGGSSAIEKTFHGAHVTKAHERRRRLDSQAIAAITGNQPQPEGAQVA